MKKLVKIISAALIAVAVPNAAAFAQSQPITLEGDVKVVKQVIEEGGETRTELVEPDRAVPGDKLIFGTNYSNTGNVAVDDFVMTNPLPKAVRLAPEADPALVVSVDGGNTWGLLSELVVALAEGGSRAAVHSDVTHIRWTLDRVEPGETGRLEYPAIIR